MGEISKKSSTITILRTGSFSHPQYGRFQITRELFEGMIEVSGGDIYPRITGSAYITAMSKLILGDGDPFKMGIPI